MTSPDTERLEPLHLACREGRLYDVERWIASGHPIQLAPSVPHPRRRKTAALGIALDQGDHALLLLLLCNGYDPDREPRNALNMAIGGAAARPR